MADFFTYKGLKKFLLYLKKEREITSFNNRQTNAAILRHDVDLSLEMAHAIAKLEKEIKVFSTFFIMVSANTYNPMSRQSQKLIKEMSDWGFEIGLHFDPTVYAKGKLSKALESEANVLTGITGKKIQTYSLHNPSISKCFDIPSKGMKNAYDSAFFSREYYISDSQKIFKKDIFDFIKSTKDHTIQILIHPLHYHTEERDYAEIYSEAFKNLINLTDKDFQANITYRHDTRPNLLDHFNRYLNRRKKGSPKHSNWQ